MESQECKVIYVEDLEVNYEIIVWEVRKGDYSKSRKRLDIKF